MNDPAVFFHAVLTSVWMLRSSLQRKSSYSCCYTNLICPRRSINPHCYFESRFSTLFMRGKKKSHCTAVRFTINQNVNIIMHLGESNLQIYVEKKTHFLARNSVYLKKKKANKVVRWRSCEQIPGVTLPIFEEVCGSNKVIQRRYSVCLEGRGAATWWSCRWKLSSHEAKFTMTPGWWDARMSFTTWEEVNVTWRGVRVGGEAGSGGTYGLSAMIGYVSFPGLYLVLNIQAGAE